MRLQLTGEIKRVYDWIVAFHVKHGRGTSMREMHTGGICSTGTSTIYTRALEELGLVVRNSVKRPTGYQALEVVPTAAKPYDEDETLAGTGKKCPACGTEQAADVKLIKCVTCGVIYCGACRLSRAYYHALDCPIWKLDDEERADRGDATEFDSLRYRDRLASRGLEYTVISQRPEADAISILHTGGTGSLPATLVRLEDWMSGAWSILSRAGE